jgi:hypothetical protein
VGAAAEAAVGRRRRRDKVNGGRVGRGTDRRGRHDDVQLISARAADPPPYPAGVDVRANLTLTMMRRTSTDVSRAIIAIATP